VYGVRVLSRYGEGNDLDILAGLAFVLTRHRAQAAAMAAACAGTTTAGTTGTGTSAEAPAALSSGACGRPLSVVSMSLGGVCTDYQECQQDSLVQAADVLADAGIVVVVAAGNR